MLFLFQSFVDWCDVVKPCMNGATCTQRANEYRCDCLNGFTGKVCDVRMVSCEVAASLKSKYTKVPPRKFWYAFCRLLIFFKINFFEKFFQEYNQSVKTVWIQIRLDILSGLIWIQTVYKGYQKMTLVDKELKRRTKFAIGSENEVNKNNIGFIVVTGSRYTIHFYYFLVEASFNSDVVECLSVDRTTRFESQLVQIGIFSLYDTLVIPIR